jgi:hypothetical protein
MTVSLHKISTLARLLGATVEVIEAGRQVSVNVDAPTGKVWAAASTHHLNTWWRLGEIEFRRDALADLFERVTMGLADCGDPDCDNCHGEQS